MEVWIPFHSFRLSGSPSTLDWVEWLKKSLEDYARTRSSNIQFWKTISSIKYLSLQQ